MQGGAAGDDLDALDRGAGVSSLEVAVSNSHVAGIVAQDAPDPAVRASTSGCSWISLSMKWSVALAGRWPPHPKSTRVAPARARSGSLEVGDARPSPGAATATSPSSR